MIVGVKGSVYPEIVLFINIAGRDEITDALKQLESSGGGSVELDCGDSAQWKRSPTDKQIIKLRLTMLAEDPTRSRDE